MCLTVLFRFTSPVQRAFGHPGNCEGSCQLCAAKERPKQQGYSCGGKKKGGIKWKVWEG